MTALGSVFSIHELISRCRYFAGSILAGIPSNAILFITATYAMNQELVICIPGPWPDRSALVKEIVSLEPMGEFLFAGSVLAHSAAKDHVAMEFFGSTPQLRESFDIAGQGKLDPELLSKIEGHKGVAYLHFPLDILEQRERLIKFTRVLQRAGGIALLVESSGIAHDWERWFELLAGDTFDTYCSVVSLIGDDETFYSCGMHHFGLPDCSIPQDIDISEAAELMNRFNLYQIDERPELATGHTFGLDVDAPPFELDLQQDPHHAPDHLFYNPHGMWKMTPA